MKYFFVLLVLAVCVAAYVRDKQPETWNSWMTAAGTTNFDVAPATPTGTADAMTDSSAPPPPPRTIPVGGLVKNGNFTPGNQYWQGDGTPDPSGQGLVVQLNPSSWTRVYQTFAGDERRTISIEITYRLSPGLTVSQNPADYTALNKTIQIPGFENYGTFKSAPGNFYGTVGDPTSASMSMEIFAPQFGSTAVQDYQHTYPPIPPNGNDTFAVAFPPGSGTVTLLTAYVTSR